MCEPCHTDRTMERFRHARALVPALLLASFVLVTLPKSARGDANGGSCTTVANVTSTVWKHAGPTVKQALNTSGPYGATAAKALQLIDEGIKIWNKIVGDQTWAKVGPRRMDFDRWNQGTLIGPTERMFVSSIPAVNPVTVDVNKLDNDGEVKVVVCKVPERGKAEAVSTFTIDKSTKKGQVRSIEIGNAKGHVISVVLHGKSLAKSLKYKVRARFSYDDEQVEKDQNTKTPPRR